MALDQDDRSITARMADEWLVTLDVNAAFDRPWTDAAVAWATDEVAATRAAGGDGDAVARATDHAIRVAAGAARAPARVVDVGCGAGGAACALAHRFGSGARVVAVDRDPRLVAQARRRAVDERVADRVRPCVGSVDALATRRGAFAVVWASGVVHHLADQQRAVDDLARLLAPGGVLALVEGGLPLRCLPHDVGLGRPGLEARLDEARARWFEDMRAELSGPPLPYGWPAALQRAGLDRVRSRSFLAEATPPLDDIGRRIVDQHLRSARDELADRLDADDRRTLEVLLDTDDDRRVGRRDDLVVAAVRTVHVGTAPDRPRVR
jgi:SAM-dependent methyltransferase